MTRHEDAGLSPRSQALLERAGELRADAELLVDPPALASLERRGRARRRRRRTAVASLAVATALVGVGIAGVLEEHRPVDTAGVPWPTGLDRWPGNPHLPLVQPGRYRFPLSPYRQVPSVRLTLGTGWHADVALTHAAGRGAVHLLVADVDQVVQRPCDSDDRGMVDVSDEPAALAAAIAGAPGLEEVAPERKVTAFGRPATLLRLRTTSAVVCPFHEPYQLIDTANGLVSAAEPGSTSDVWVVDVEGRGILVAATTSPEADPAGRALLRQTLATIELVPPE